MSELINTHDNRAAIRWKLLASVSALALMVSSIGAARAEDADHPMIWIELGGQLEHIGGQGASYSPGFLSAYSTSSILQQKLTPLQAQQPPLFSAGEEAKITFQPDGSDWVFSAAVRYGRSGNQRDVHHQTTGVHVKYDYAGKPEAPFTQEKFVDSHIYHAENHAIMDFMVGRDVGLGLFGKGSSTVLSAGVRVAQFASHSSDDMRARPDLNWRGIAPYFHTYHVYENAAREFRGVGPSISWNGSAPFAGNSQDGELAIDWGANAAVLFGRQKTRVQHHESGHYQSEFAWFVCGNGGSFPVSCLYQPVYQHTGEGHSLNRTVVVPNLGASAAISYRYSDAKLTLGYRADFFFGAIDGGIDKRRSETLNMGGPFASISFGLGD